MGDNMKEFDEWFLKILKHLYSEFPKEIEFDSSDITGTKETETNEIFFGTMRFLSYEGYIRFKAKKYDGGCNFMQVALTAKGLSILKHSSTSLVNETFIDKLNGAIKSGSSSAISAVVQGIVQTYLPT